MQSEADARAAGPPPAALPPAVLTRRSVLRGLALLAAVPAVPAVLAGCAPPTKPPSTAQVLRVGWTSDIDSQNPLTSTTSEAVEVWQLVYDRLFQYDRALAPEPCLATGSTTSPDGRTVTYALRPGVTWHDGQPFTADDVVWTYDTIHGGNIGAFAAYLTDLTSVTATNPTTVVATFAKPQTLDPGLLLPILPRHLWSSLKPDDIQKFDNAAMVGTGPFRFGEWKRGQDVRLVRNDTWWGPKPAASAVSWQLYANDDVMAQGLRNGDVDVLLQVPPTVYDGMAAEGTVRVSLPSFSFHHIGINVSDKPGSKGNPLLRDKAVRQALSCAVNRSQLVAVALAGHGTPATTLLPAAFGDWQYKVPPEQVLDNDPAKAAALLDAAGYTRSGSDVRKSRSGQPLSFRLIAIESTSVDVRAAQLLQQAASAVGIELKLTTLDSNTLSSTVYNADAPDWDVFVWGWDSQTPDPSYLLSVPTTEQIGSNNDVFYSNPAYDALFAQQVSQTDRAARLDTVHRMQQIFYDDCAYLVMWYQDKLQAYRSAAWSGWQNATGGLVFNFTRDNYLDVTATA